MAGKRSPPPVFTGWFVDKTVYGAVDDYDWKFGDFDAGFTSRFDPFALGSTRSFRSNERWAFFVLLACSSTEYRGFELQEGKSL